MIWRDGQSVELPTPWENGGRAYSITNAGEIVGTAYDPDGMWWPVMWRPHHPGHGDHGLSWHVTLLDSSPGYARAVSDSGRVAGTAGPDFDMTSTTGWPMAWDLDGSRTLLPPLGDVTRGAANSVNERGESVGFAGINGGDVPPAIPVAVYWQTDHSDPIGLGTLATDGSGFGFARAINGHGDVVGTSTDSYADGYPQAFFVKRLCEAEH